MSELVERLRDRRETGRWGIRREAANEIERLTAEVERLKFAERNTYWLRDSLAQARTLLERFYFGVHRNGEFCISRASLLYADIERYLLPQPEDLIEGPEIRYFSCPSCANYFSATGGQAQCSDCRSVAVYEGAATRPEENPEDGTE